MSLQTVGVLGSGIVGEVLSNAFLDLGYKVARGSRSPDKLSGWLDGAGDQATVGTFAEVAMASNILVLSVKGTAAMSVLEMCGSGSLDGKTVIDTTNPIADAPPENGVLRYFTGPNESLMERLQDAFPDANFVKAFSCVGNALMVNPDFDGVKPTMFIAGNDSRAKAAVGEILRRFGWEFEDMGSAEAARAIEPLCMLWCIPGFLRNEWSHAFKMLAFRDPS